jgi:hypothetical protein
MILPKYIEKKNLYFDNEETKLEFHFCGLATRISAFQKLGVIKKTERITAVLI